MPNCVVPLLTVALVVCGGVSTFSAQEPPAKETPAQQAPAKEPPPNEAPAQEAQQAPAQEAPAPQAPAQEAPAQEAPSEKPAVQEAPVQRPPVKEPVAYERVPRKAKLFIEGEETVDASNSKNKASYGNFTVAIAAALTKKKVPVIVVTDPERADFLVTPRPPKRTVPGPRLRRWPSWVVCGAVPSSTRPLWSSTRRAPGSSSRTT